MSEYAGIIIEESLENKTVLGELSIASTKIVPVTERHKTPWVKQWTFLNVEIPEDEADEIAEKLSKSLETEHAWYADYKNDQYHFIIYREKIFKVDLKNPVLYKDAKEYGLSIGIPDYQVNFTPKDKI